MKKPKPDPIETALADLFARDIERERAAGRHDNVRALEALLGSEPPTSDVRVVTE